MNANTQMIAKALANEFLMAFKQVIGSNVGINVKSGMNSLQASDMARSAEARYVDKDGDMLLELLVNDYIKYIESGRRKKAKFPPVAPIVQWARKNGIPTDNGTIFLIRRAISRGGIPARPIFESVWQNIDQEMDAEYFDQIFESIITELNKYFNE